ncbi:MAG: 30S ribosomal protein S20 [Acidobacteria bacterium]|jgi:small subunit ribosomal protein S20|nr:30S ribosomal protein S20 [Acidobacteriota bacterium]OQB54694.1 MAG: 30S ribosomal protein S20 [Candidatus Aminicenantes bacterium ADurb.Bin147]HNQ79729.1 30S ribosomal protein S20 [Candidatus Aminicenantes bacterium]NMD11476.1 30S ribosomal protein S20 [Acidobacteriota bacterium]HNT31293.1 30S ribosomal protein S20 [Candidatus Aminicenantes bacterium]
MAKHASAERQHRASLRRNAVNTKNKSSLRTQVKKLRVLIKAGDKSEAQKALPSVNKIIDQTIKKGAIHKNTGSRYKSRLSRQITKISDAPAK